MNSNNPTRVLDEISDAMIPKDLDLLPAILTKLQSRNLATQRRATSLRFAGLLLILIILIFFFSLPGVASALKTIFGYIPRVGVVDQGASLRVLANPVKDTRGGYTITIESAVLDPAHTVITYRISGQFPSWEDPSLMPVMCESSPVLRLADGQEFSYPSREGSLSDGEVRWTDIFPAIPAADQHVLLAFPCLSNLPAGKGPQNWEIPLAFAPAPPDMTIYPLVELPNSTPTSPELMTPASEFQVTLRGFSELDSGYYLQAMLGWEKILNAYEVQVYPDAIHLVDAAGNEVPIWPANQTPLIALVDDHKLALDFQTTPILSDGPAQLVIDYIGVSMAAAAQFTLNVGDAPQPGQFWEVNKELKIDEFTLNVLSAEYIQPEPGEPPWLMLYLASDSGILTVTAMDSQHEIMGTGGSPGSAQVPFRAGWRYKNGFPHGQITVDITSITVRRAGPWSTAWIPPIASHTPTAEAPVSSPAENGICLDESSFQAAPGKLPAGVAGRAIFSKSNYEMTVANFDESDAISVGSGVFPDISLDGKRIVYRRLEGGIFIHDLSGGKDVLISGPIRENVSDIWPIWSPNGKQIVFDRVINHASDMYLVNADGSELHAVLSGPEDESPIGWSPDGRQIYYSVSTLESVSVRVYDLETGLSVETIKLPLESTQIKLSPDGSRLAYLHGQDIYLATFENEPPVLVFSGSDNVVNPIWSPDGIWIAITYLGTSDTSNSSIALIQPDTCQFVFLGESKEGWLWSWAP